MHRPRSILLAAAATLGVVACGGDDKGSSSTADTSVTATGDTTSDTATTPDTAATGGDFTPGSDQYRVVNLLNDPVDLYARTTDGLVEAFLLETGLASGEVSQRYSPPDPGVLAVLEAGADDAECVINCPHILVESRANTDTGPFITEVLYNEGDTVRSFTVWEQPPADGIPASNRMPEADPGAGLFIPLAVALTDADFGLQIADANGSGCLTNRDSANVLVGGNQTPVFAYDGASIDVTFHDNRDSDCTGEILGGPFTITGGAGTRTLLILTGTPGAIDAISLPLGDDTTVAAPDTTEPTGSTGSTDEATAVATEAMTSFLFSNLPTLTEEEAACLATELVNDIGADRLLASDGFPLDYGNLSTELNDELSASLLVAVESCGVDPSAVGG